MASDAHTKFAPTLFVLTDDCLGVDHQQQQQPVARAPFAGMFGRARGGRSGSRGGATEPGSNAGGGEGNTQRAGESSGGKLNWTKVKRVFTDASQAAKVKTSSKQVG